GSLDLKAIVSTVYEEVRRAIPADRFSYYRYNAQRETLETMFDRSLEEGSTSDSPAPEESLADRNVLDAAISEGKSMFLRGSTVSDSMIIAPVRSGQTIAGLLVVSGRGPELDDDAHLRLLESIANLTEIALEKASLYEDIVTKSREIEHRNKELDDFTYVVSHDLKEPLISIEGYSKILLKEYQEEIGDSGKIYLSSLVNSSTRLKNLIDDLLTLSRLGRVTEAVAQVPLDAMFQDVLQDIQFTLQEANATVEVEGTLPNVLYNPTQLGMVVRNLISNAIKFNDKPAPRVVLRCSTDETMHHVSVSDNGIGIEEAYFAKIFMIFQRLHRTEEYRGTGTGLTIVKKIVENHGGTVTVSSVPGEGSTFTFTIPISQQ
ncbi:MAG: ATP-binding protein, partial [Ignavibacteria bacterium]|nr:ATP-binding protein [Ignavibacteria bacterium]